MKEIFILNTQRGSESKNLYVQSHKAKNYGENSLKTLGPKIWNSLPDHFKVSTTPHKNIETNSRFTRKIDISSHMESLNFQSGNDETA